MCLTESPGQGECVLERYPGAEECAGVRQRPAPQVRGATAPRPGVVQLNEGGAGTTQEVSQDARGKVRQGVSSGHHCHSHGNLYVAITHRLEMKRAKSDDDYLITKSDLILAHFC